MGGELTYAVGARYLMLLVKADFGGSTRRFLVVSVVRLKTALPNTN